MRLDWEFDKRKWKKIIFFFFMLVVASNIAALLDIRFLPLFAFSLLCYFAIIAFAYMDIRGKRLNED